MISTRTGLPDEPPQDRVSRVLIWILLVVTIGCWSAMIWSTAVTYRKAAPLPQ